MAIQVIIVQAMTFAVDMPVHARASCVHADKCLGVAITMYIVMASCVRADKCSGVAITIYIVMASCVRADKCLGVRVDWPIASHAYAVAPRMCARTHARMHAPSNGRYAAFLWAITM